MNFSKKSSPARGFWVVLIGPDGVGKTSVAKKIPEDFRQHFSTFGYHHWIPQWTKPLCSEVPPGGGRFTPAPCKVTIINRILSIVRLMRNVVRAWMGYCLRVRPRVRKGGLVLGDRYLFNYHLDPESVFYCASSRWVQKAFRLVPKPSLVISLVADPAVIHARKAELTIAEISERLARSHELQLLGFNLVEISADAPLPLVQERVRAAILHTIES